MKAACVYLTLALRSTEDEGLLAVIFSLNANKTCKTYLKMKTSLHGTMKKIWFYRFWDLLSYPLKARVNNQEEWLTSANINFRDVNSNDKKTNCYGICVRFPTITTEDVIPDDFPVPCSCLKCAKKNVCPCLVKLISCCKFCNCEASSSCNNTFNYKSSISGSYRWQTNLS